jgi:hypothetical protein
MTLTELYALGPLYLFACWHVMMPGHGKTLLVAVCLSCNERSRLLPMALGYGLSHGLLMALAALGGLLLTSHLAAWISEHGIWVKNLYLPLLLLFGTYFAGKAYREHRGSGLATGDDHASLSVASRRPFLTGMGIGAIPCSDVLGLAVISPMLVKTGHNLPAVGFTVWLGVVSTILLIAVALRLVPAGWLTRRVSGGMAYLASSAICFFVLIWRCWRLWNDYSSLSGSF